MNTTATSCPDEIDRADLGTLGRQLGQGGQARVFAAPELRLPDTTGPLVFKEYRQGQATPHGLRGIVAVRSRLTPDQRSALDSCAAWPMRVVRDATGMCGVIMPLIGDEFFQPRTLPSGLSDYAPREVQNMFIDPELAGRLGMPLLPLVQRLAICRDLAAALGLLHAHGVIFGDVNAKNALFRATPAASVLLVDCDAVRIKGSAAVVRQLNSPDWDPPEGAVLSQATDVYKLGLFVIRALSPGRQCSTARDPARITPLLDGAGQTLLTLTLSRDPAQRPTARQWWAYFAERITTLTVARRAAARRATPPIIPGTGRHMRTPSAPASPSSPGLVPADNTSGALRGGGWRRDPGTGQWAPADLNLRGTR